MRRSVYVPFLERVEAERLQPSVPGFPLKKHLLPVCFKILFDYRTKVEKVLTFSSGVLEASGLYAYAHRKAGELNGIIREHVRIIDDLLVALISPQAKTFTVEELSKDYDYPDVDLNVIDADWW